MAIQLSTIVRNACLDAIETTAGSAAKLLIFTGSQPVNCAAADSGTMLVSLDLPANWMSAAAAGQKSLVGLWTGAAVANGTAGHFRLKDQTGLTCHIQGTISLLAGSGDLKLSVIALTAGVVVTVTSFTLTDPNG